MAVAVLLFGIGKPQLPIIFLSTPAAGLRLWGERKSCFAQGVALARVRSGGRPMQKESYNIAWLLQSKPEKIVNLGKFCFVKYSPSSSREEHVEYCGFVSGHDFSRAVNAQNQCGL
jgi:hypothetical protein